MKDRYGRTIDYLRLSVTDRCNLHCVYCQNGRNGYRKFADMMSAQEIVLLVKHLKKKGLKRVKITGGEPLLRKDIGHIIRRIAHIQVEVSLTTNGVLLADKAETLFNAGLRRLNVGLDCLDRRLFEKITGSNKLGKVMEGLEAALEVGFNPVKVNVVLIKGLNEEIEPWLNLVKKKNVTVRFIELMPVGVVGDGSVYRTVPSSEIIQKVNKFGELMPVQLEGGGPAKHYHIKGFKGNIGFISSKTDNFCKDCNRLRTNAFGQLRNCLFSPETFDFLKLARNGYSEAKLTKLLDYVLAGKPKNNKGLRPVEDMCQIGG